MSYGYYGYGRYYQGPGAVSQLDGPGSSATVQTAYHGSYAYESMRGGIYTSDLTYNTNDFISHSSYIYMGPDYGTRSTDIYHDYTSHTQASPYSDFSNFYYSIGYSPYGYTTFSNQSTTGVYHYVGNNEYLDRTSQSSSETSDGYTFSTYSHSDFERTDGQFDAGSSQTYSVRSVTDPYGYSTYSISHT
ncbi:MAG: hypothetical protein ACRYGP_24470 [Janthinobacterium lividum]